MPEARKPSTDTRTSAQDQENERLGTRMLPVPDKSPTVAGMPREDRAITDPGHPGIPRPEDDVYANDPADLSERPSDDTSAQRK